MGAMAKFIIIIDTLKSDQEIASLNWHLDREITGFNWHPSPANTLANGSRKWHNTFAKQGKC